MHSKLIEAALGVGAPWFLQGVDFDTDAKSLTVRPLALRGHGRMVYADAAGDWPFRPAAACC